MNAKLPIKAREYLSRRVSILERSRSTLREKWMTAIWKKWGLLSTILGDYSLFQLCKLPLRECKVLARLNVIGATILPQLYRKELLTTRHLLEPQNLRTVPVRTAQQLNFSIEKDRTLTRVPGLLNLLPRLCNHSLTTSRTENRAKGLMSAFWYQEASSISFGRFLMPSLRVKLANNPTLWTLGNNWPPAIEACQLRMKLRSPSLLLKIKF